MGLRLRRRRARNRRTGLHGARWRSFAAARLRARLIRLASRSRRRSVGSRPLAAPRPGWPAGRTRLCEILCEMRPQIVFSGIVCCRHSWGSLAGFPDSGTWFLGTRHPTVQRHSMHGPCTGMRGAHRARVLEPQVVCLRVHVAARGGRASGAGRGGAGGKPTRRACHVAVMGSYWIDLNWAKLAEYWPNPYRGACVIKREGERITREDA